MPFNPIYKAPDLGNLLQHPDGALIARSQVIHSGGITQPAYVYLTDGKADSPKGTCVQTLSMVNMRGISRSFELEVRPEPVNITATG